MPTVSGKCNGIRQNAERGGASAGANDRGGAGEDQVGETAEEGGRWRVKYCGRVDKE